MKLLYGFSNCSYKKYNEMFKNASVMILQQAQKYHSLMTAGLAQSGSEIQCISGLPVNRSLDSHLYIRGGNDEENGVRYHYFSTIQLPGLRHVMLVLKAFFYTLFYRNPDAAVCDILNISIVCGMLLACKIRRIPIIGIVTDVPGHLASNMGNRGMIDAVDAWIMKKMDGYVLLTQAMNQLVNPLKHPYIVIEGQVDKEMRLRDNQLSDKEYPKVLMYAGSLKRIYGIDRLVDAFLQVNNSDWHLHIYGDGDFREDLISICREKLNVKYKGICLNEGIVNAEIRASLLVNPRPTADEYTKYSFPSKNMEYMVSGTPVLTTLLPGMPEEYKKYVFLFDDESEEGMTETLRNVMSMSAEELHATGLKSKQYVLKEKNNMAQGKKVIDLLCAIKGEA